MKSINLFQKVLALVIFIAGISLFVAYKSGLEPKSIIETESFSNVKPKKEKTYHDSINKSTNSKYKIDSTQREMMSGSKVFILIDEYDSILKRKPFLGGSKSMPLVTPQLDTTNIQIKK